MTTCWENNSRLSCVTGTSATSIRDGEDPVIDRSVIRIVDLPDATITPVDTLCEFENSVILSAATGGGTWSGNGIVNSLNRRICSIHCRSRRPRDHIQCYRWERLLCMDTETIVVEEAPKATISPVDPFCIYNAVHDLEAATA